MARTLSETIAEGRRQARFFRTVILGNDDALRVLDVAEKTLALFAALDRERPGWREETCAIGGDEVCRAWYELEKSLALGPDDEGKEKSNG